MHLATPVLVAAGCGGTGRELEPFAGPDGRPVLDGLGAFTTRTVTLDPRAGGPRPRVVETPAGLVHDTGGHNPGLNGFLATELPWLAQRQVRTVVSVAGGTLGEYAELARRIGGSPGVTAVEVDLSAANREAHGRPFGADPYQAGKVLAVVRRDAPRGVPVLAKLLPESPLVDVARACVDNGADALVVGHGPAALSLDPGTLRPAPAHGRLAGPAGLPLALRRVHDLHAALPGDAAGRHRRRAHRPGRAGVPARRRDRGRGGQRAVPRPRRDRPRHGRAGRRARRPRPGPRRRRGRPGPHRPRHRRRTRMTFGTRLQDLLEDRGRLCAGIDPHPGLMDRWGLTDSAIGLERFALTAVEALAGTVAVVKPQSAFFERHGSQGVAVLEKVVEGCRDLGALVLLDVKRGDIGSTAQAYADAYLAPTSSLAVDAVTVSPFLGMGSLDPFFDTADAHGKGVITLALTSNPEGPQFQHATTAGGGTVAGDVLAAVRDAQRPRRGRRVARRRRRRDHRRDP